jgi:hypothetical protein
MGRELPLVNQSNRCARRSTRQRHSVCRALLTVRQGMFHLMRRRLDAVQEPGPTPASRGFKVQRKASK